MCTVTWTHEADGYQLLCNRDEKRSRLPASHPRLEKSRGAAYLAPCDGDFGGSWLAVNSFGVSLCLLNGTASGVTSEVEAPAAQRSRGLLIRDLATARSQGDALTAIAGMDLTIYPPFTLVSLEPGMASSLVEWDGREMSVFLNAERFLPLVSSSVDPLGVRQRRAETYQRLIRENGACRSGALFSFHSSHSPAPGPYSPCMHRPDAETVSFSRVRVTAEEVEFFYSPAAPCQWVAGETSRLARVE